MAGLKRDAAIKLMRQGSILQHISDFEYYYTISDGSILVRLEQDPWRDNPFDIFRDVFDDGWIFVKPKVKKTYWLNYDVDAEELISTDLFLSEIQAKSYVKRRKQKIIQCPVVIEEEE